MLAQIREWQSECKRIRLICFIEQQTLEFSFHFVENLFAWKIRSKNANERPAIAYCWRLCDSNIFRLSVKTMVLYLVERCCYCCYYYQFSSWRERKGQRKRENEEIYAQFEK